VKASHPRRDEWPDLLNPVGHPIADCVPTKLRSIKAMAGRRQNLAAKLPWERVGGAKAVFGQAFGACPFDRANPGL